MDEIKCGDTVFVPGTFIAGRVGSHSVDLQYQRVNGAHRLCSVPREIVCLVPPQSGQPTEIKQEKAVPEPQVEKTRGKKRTTPRV